MDEQYFENLLSIKTSGEQNVSEATEHYNRYEPTSYLALEKFFSEYTLAATDSLVDFGCGMGRLNFYLNNKFKIKTTGIEMNPYFFNASISNLNSYLTKYNDGEDKISFLNILAEDYTPTNTDNKFYFFNPFSVQIFMKVLEKILISACKSKRNIDIILFYPSEDYIFFIENCNLFTLTHEVKLPNFINDTSERFLVYKLTAF
ncbi:SAM-dependent methyltransferase [uncultured Clostridium sp.]|uniref:SAM-dependent methyltransferase n=1 Tax=uncultured Clostridium sp. TaxID=59620 RepID=UPI002628A985|nr:SAM-dependent methyltransferase [uncultured Clostridium sp.]